jgi:hypothetical protein
MIALPLDPTDNGCLTVTAHRLRFCEVNNDPLPD